MCCPQCCTAGDFGSHEFCSGPLTGICCGKPFSAADNDEERIAWRLVPREEPKYLDTREKPSNQEYVEAQNVVYGDKMKGVLGEKQVKTEREEKRKDKEEKKKEKKALERESVKP